MASKTKKKNGYAVNHRGHYVFNAKELARFRKDYESGLSVAKVCEKHDVSQRSMRTALIKAGVKFRNKNDVVYSKNLGGIKKYRDKKVGQLTLAIDSTEKPKSTPKAKRTPLTRKNLADVAQAFANHSEEIVQRYEDGESIASLAKAYGVTYTSMLNGLKKLDIKIRNGQENLSCTDRDKVVSLYRDAGMSKVNIAKIFKVSLAYIDGVFHSAGVKVRKHTFLTEEQIEKINFSLKSGVSATSLADFYEVSPTTIRRIAREKNEGSSDVKDINHSEIVQAYEKGAKLRSLGRQYGCSACKIERILRNEGVTIRKRRTLSQKDKLKIVELYLSGVKPEEIAKKYETSSSNVESIVWTNYGKRKR